MAARVLKIDPLVRFPCKLPKMHLIRNRHGNSGRWCCGKYEEKNIKILISCKVYYIQSNICDRLDLQRSVLAKSIIDNYHLLNLEMFQMPLYCLATASLYGMGEQYGMG